MAMDRVDLNCDLGEGFGQWSVGEASDESLMAMISSANVAAGFHAGDANHMDRVVKLAKQYGVGLGAHPGYHDLQGFGRRIIQSTSEELINDIIYQIGAMREFGRRHGLTLQHLKPHGALYMKLADDHELASGLLEELASYDPSLLFYCMHGTTASEVASQLGLKTVHEFYADRDYNQTGTIVFARKMRALDPQEVAEKCVRACAEGVVQTIDNIDVPIIFDSICFHSDTPGAFAIGTAIREALTAAGIDILRPAPIRH